MIFPILLVIFSWKSSISVQSTLPPRVKPKQTLCRESESSVFYTDNPSEKILRCGGGFRTFIFNTKTSSFSYSDYTLKSLYRLWLGECNKIWKSSGIDRKKKPIHARTRAKLLCQFCAISLQKQATFGDMWQ